MLVFAFEAARRVNLALAAIRGAVGLVNAGQVTVLVKQEGAVLCQRLFRVVSSVSVDAEEVRHLVIYLSRNNAALGVAVTCQDLTDCVVPECGFLVEFIGRVVDRGDGLRHLAQDGPSSLSVAHLQPLVLEYTFGVSEPGQLGVDLRSGTHDYPEIFFFT